MAGAEGWPETDWLRPWRPTGDRSDRPVKGEAQEVAGLPFLVWLIVHVRPVRPGPRPSSARSGCRRAWCASISSATTCGGCRS